MISLKSGSYVALTLILFVLSASVRVPATQGEEISTNSSSIAKSRAKRYLIFQPGTRILFRVNVKDNILKVNQIFAHAFGFRANIDLLQPTRPPKPDDHKIRRRDVYETIEELINLQGFNGRKCIMKTLCDAAKNPSHRAGMFSKLFKLIFSQHEELDTNSLSESDEPDFRKCADLEKHCPLSLLELSPYSDI